MFSLFRNYKFLNGGDNFYINHNFINTSATVAPNFVFMRRGEKNFVITYTNGLVEK